MTQPQRPTITLIAAVAANGVIGRDNDLPWRLPDDMKHFMRTTMGSPVIMGRRTFESMDGPLPGRLNIVVTRRADYQASGAQVVGSLREAVAAAGPVSELFIAGGGQLYAEALELADRMWLTEIDQAFDGDTRFPDFDRSKWRAVQVIEHPADARHAYPFRIVRYERAGDG